MKIKNNKYNLKELEYIFAQDFNTPLSYILAESYFQLSEYNKSTKVCEIALKHNKHNIMIQYVLAKLYLLNDNYLNAEKLLKNVIDNNISHFKALKLFINIKIFLNSNLHTYKKYIQRAYKINPSNSKIKNLYNTLNLKKHTTTQSLIIKKRDNKIQVNEKLATKTMYSVFV